jgi:hypothetical protein
LCESLLAEITTQAVPVEVVSDVPCPLSPEWMYSVQLYPTAVTGLIAVEVSVYRATLHRYPTNFRLVRWMQDPGAELSSDVAPNASAASPALTR